jgi:[protein-PII] uridylyltransferase
VLDVFWAQDVSGDPISNAKRAKLLVMIERMLAGSLSLEDMGRLKAKLPERVRSFRVTPRVLIDNEASSTHTIIEINGLDRPGLLHDVTMALTRLNLQIASAKISTYGHKVIDIFYVKDIFGLKVLETSKHKRIRTALLAALGETPERERRKKAQATEAAE